MRRLAGIFVSIVALVCAVSVSTCIFDTRDANPPGDVTGGCTLDAPQKAFVCMTNSLTSQQDADYERALSETFFFSPTLADSLDQNFIGVPVYDNWNKDVEMEVLALLFSDAQKTIVDFGDPIAKINKNTFVRFEVKYALTVITEALPADTTTYKGEAWFDVRNENGNWRLTSWREIATVEGFSTWGFLRGILKLRLGP